MSAVFDRKAALKLVDNDEELLNILLETFLETEFSPEHLEELISSGKKSEAASYTHRVKGAGRQLAMQALASSGQELEDVLREKKSGDIKALTQVFYSDYLNALETIKKELSD